jgi:hypothetical protein
LVVLPIARVSLESPVRFPRNVIFYPTGVADIEALKVVPNDSHSRSLAEVCSALSGITAETFYEQASVAFPISFEWRALSRMSHRDHLEFIRSLSEAVDDLCLNFIRYRLCRIEPIDDLPSRAGQIASNRMMACALLYNPAQLQGRIIAGAAFTHLITRGLGLTIGSLGDQDLPADGEVGQFARHALSLYAAMLELDNPTAKFVQAMALLDFLAEPREYKPFKDLKKTIARYIASTVEDYKRILDRFLELTGKKDPVTQEFLGYRTRIVHLGDRLDKILPNPSDRRTLFEELDSYIRPIIDHMIAHSDLAFDAYVAVRERMPNFEG